MLIIVQSDKFKTKTARFFLVPDNDLPKPLLKRLTSLAYSAIMGNSIFMEERSLVHELFGIGLTDGSFTSWNDKMEKEKCVKNALKVETPLFKKYDLGEKIEFKLDEIGEILIIKLNGDT